jgi:hypothetical protein
MKIHRLAAVFAVASLCAGCASVMEGSTQTITVATYPVSGANCIGSNDRGQWPVVSPGSVLIQKSQSVLMIVCSKPGYADGKFYASGRMSGASLISGMIPYVGMVNSMVDASTGAALTYPSSYTIEMKPLAAGAPPATPTAAAIPAPATVH